MFNIDKITIDCNRAPFIVAEMSGNHNQSLDRALDIVDAAADAGARAIKLQTYTADTLTLNIREGEFLVNSANSLWGNRSLYDLYDEAHTPWEWHEPIMRRAKKLVLICFSTPFDKTAVEFLEDLEVPAYKIASFENNHLPLIESVALTGKPMLISTGMASEGEIREAVTIAREAGCGDLMLLKCTSSYPATPKNTNALTIPHMRELFGCEVGLSDHTMGVGTAVAAVAHGATLIEKHFTLCRADGGVDSTFSLEPDEMRSLVIETERAWQSLGKVSYGPTEGEESSLIFRRSLYIAVDMEEGEVLTQENLRIIRPGFGLAPKHYHGLLGQKVNQSVKKGTAMKWTLVD